MRGKSLETFEECRKAHLKSVLPNYSYAEAQYNYLMNNIRLPEGVQVRDMNDQIEALSPLMSLLPRIWEDPNPSYQNGELDHILPRNKPFSDTATCQMLLNSMPHMVQAKWKADNLGRQSQL